jgi:4'-phosphopantetheinyl transferase
MTSVNLENIPANFSFQGRSASVPEIGEVVIHVAEITAMTSQDLTLLSLEEQEKARSMTTPAVRERFVAGRKMIRQNLSLWLGADPSAICMEVGESGKPFVKEDPSLHFSISHSGELLMAAFSRTEIGVDLERQRDIQTEALAKRFFSSEEARYLNECSDGDTVSDDFFRLWTCREAAIKADGRGMGSLLASTRVVLPPKPINPIHPIESAASEHSRAEMNEILEVMIANECWQVLPWRVRGGYHAALALRQRPTLIHWRDFR